MHMEDEVADRIHFLMDDNEKARYQEVARREGKTLSVWLREAAEAKYQASVDARALGPRSEGRRPRTMA